MMKSNMFSVSRFDYIPKELYKDICREHKVPFFLIDGIPKFKDQFELEMSFETINFQSLVSVIQGYLDFPYIQRFTDDVPNTISTEIQIRIGEILSMFRGHRTYVLDFLSSKLMDLSNQIEEIIENIIPEPLSKEQIEEIIQKNTDQFLHEYNNKHYLLLYPKFLPYEIKTEKDLYVKPIISPSHKVAFLNYLGVLDFLKSSIKVRVNIDEVSIQFEKGNYAKLVAYICGENDAGHIGSYLSKLDGKGTASKVMTRPALKKIREIYHELSLIDTPTSND